MNLDELTKATLKLASNFGSSDSATVLYHKDITEIGDPGKILASVGFVEDNINYFSLFFTEKGLLGAATSFAPLTGDYGSPPGSTAIIQIAVAKHRELSRMTPQAIFQDNPRELFCPVL